jgi:transposase InsO family protein
MAGMGAAPAQAPRLRSAAGSYAAWKPDMEVYLERIGADGVHKRTMTDEGWNKMILQVQIWNDEALAQALASIGVGAATSSTSSSSSSGDTNNPAVVTAEQKETRRLLGTLVERSRRVFGVIWASLPDGLRTQAAHVPQGSAASLWMWLQRKFQNTEEDSVWELFAQWVALAQDEEETFDAYRARVNHIQSLLDHAKEKQSPRMYTFTLLDKLQPRYKPAVLALKAGGRLKDPAQISWDEITSFLNQHERSESRMAESSDAAIGGVGAAATTPASARGSSGGTQPSNRGGWQKRGGARNQRGGRGGGRERHNVDPRTCFRCDERGHVAADCTKPPKASRGEGQPASSPTPPKGEQASTARVDKNRFQALSSDEDEEAESAKFCVAISLPKKVSFAPSEQALATITDEMPKQSATEVKQPSTSRSNPTVMATSASASKAVNLSVALADYAWGWDTMASVDCSGNKKHFINMRPCRTVPVKGMDGNIVKASQIGSVEMTVKSASGQRIRIVVNDVLYDKSFACNLLSNGRMVNKHGWQSHSTPEATYLITPGGHRIDLSTQGNVSVLMGVEPERAFASLIPGAGVVQNDSVDQLVQLHQRLCHMGWTRMMNMLRSGKVEDHGIDVSTLSTSTIATAEKEIRECMACTLGRATRVSFGHRGLDRGTKAGECVHMDSYQVKVNRDGRRVKEYGVVIKDMYSDTILHERLVTKDLIANSVKKQIRQIETQFGCVVKRVYADGGTEFINQTLKEYCASNGKQLHWTPPRTQQLNGGSERTVRTTKDSANMMMQHADAPIEVWKWAAAHATFVWNRTHISKRTGMTPYECLRGKKPSLGHLRGTWGCDAYCHVPDKQRRALEAKAEPCIYLGHNEAQNAANVLLLGSKKVICSRDVTYRNSSFEFIHALKGERVAESLDATDEEQANLDRMPAREEQNRDGSSAASSSSATPSNLADDSKEWDVDSIVSEKSRRGQMYYKVHWSGFGNEEDTWESADVLKDAKALDLWQALHHPDPPQPRRSARHGGHATDEMDRALRYAEQESGDDELDSVQVQMAMCALRGLQLIDEQPDIATLMSAIAAGVAGLEQRTPKTHREAMSGSDSKEWAASEAKEMASCMAQKVWILVPRKSLPDGTNILPCKTVYKIKVDERGEITEFKSRFTPKGFRQKHNLDYFETYARTGQYKTLRAHLSLAAKWDHELLQFDVPTAFLFADVEEDVYMELPDGFEQPGMVCKLQKSLYGLKQAPRNWDKLIHNFITTATGFKATVSDPSIYFKRSRSGRVMMIYRFVDDMQGSFHREDTAEFQEHVATLEKRFNIKTLKSATWMLGMRITRDRKARTINLDQELYITKALERFGLQQCRTVSTPEAVGAATEMSAVLNEPADNQRYMEITGTLMYAAISTRPDIAHAVHYLASNMQAPTRRHMIAAERVLRYLAGTKEVGLVFGSRNGGEVGDSRGRKSQIQVEVCAFADADWANDKGDRKSISGWVAKLNGDPISWSSKKQRVVALSTCEAELYAEAAAIQEVLWLRGLLEELGLHTRTGSVVFGDNQSTIAVSQNGVRSDRTKHVDVKYHFITEAVDNGVVKLVWVPTTQQQADIFTKALATPDGFEASAENHKVSGVFS